MHPGLQGGVAGQVVRGVRVVERERLLLEIEDIDGATCSLELLGHVADDDARHGIALQAADDRQDV